MPRYLTEFVGTFLFVLMISLIVDRSDAHLVAGVAIGSALMVMVYMGGHISGAHYNPAVTVAVFLRGKLPVSDILPYMVAQFGGAIAAACVGWVVSGRTPAPAPGIEVSLMAALLVEVLFTFALGLVVLNVATTDATKGNSYYGLAIGFTVTAAAYAGGPISGGVFNPAVGTGLIIANTLHGGVTGREAEVAKDIGVHAHSAISYLWLYLVGPFAGGILAYVIYKLQHGAKAANA